MDEVIAKLTTDHAVLVVRVDHHDDRISDLVEESKWARRLIIGTLLTVVMTLATTLIGIVLGG